jgi:hypothetical protein
MDTVKAILTKPLDGQPEGTKREFDKVDFDKLVAFGAVRADDAPDEAEEGKKAAPPVQNKKAPPAENKDIVRTDPLDHDGDGRKGGSLPKAGQ